MLAAGASLIWWTVRDLPRQTRPAVRAALRADRPLAWTYFAIACCVVLYVLVAVTGFGAFAAMAWLILILLGGLALVMRLVRRRQRRHGRR